VCGKILAMPELGTGFSSGTDPYKHRVESSGHVDCAIETRPLARMLSWPGVQADWLQHKLTYQGCVMQIIHTSTSIIIVNLNGRQWLGDCLDSLASQDYPHDRVEIILVDNGSTDDSVQFVRQAYPHVRVIEAGRNLGFAGGNNRGASFATGDYLALINNDARADPHWLSAMAQVLQNQPDVACVAAKILSQDGQTIDFVGPVMNLYGRAFQIDEGLPALPGFYDEPRELLAPCGGAMMVRRNAFEQIGGFDEDYIAYFEDLDLGWRLWLYGYRVMFAPGAIVYHRAHSTGSTFPVEQRYALSETNALRTVIKNYAEENLWRVLPFSLFMGVKRSLDQAGLNRERYMLTVPQPGNTQAGATEPEQAMTRVATSFLVAIDRVADEMPRLLAKRQRIQAARVQSDQDIFARFPMRADNRLFPWREYTVLQDQLVTELGVPPALHPRHGSRLLIITHETIGARMAGPGIRAWEMACALAEQFDVTLAAPGLPTRSHPGLRVVGYETDPPHYPSLSKFIASADVVLAMGELFARIQQLRDLGKPAILDLYDPFELEKLAQSPFAQEQFQERTDAESGIHLRLEGALGDFFICASERQRDLWLGVLLAAGRINAFTYRQDHTLRRLIDVVPFGMPIHPPLPQRPALKGVHPGIHLDDKVLLWNGGLWQWFDPLTVIDALAQVLQVRQDVKLFFAAGRHFNSQTVPEMPIYAQTVERCRELGLLDRHVFFGDWIPYDERGDYLLEADLSVSAHQAGLESHFASRTRLLDCIWAGLPIVSTQGDPISDMVAERGLGYTVPPARPDLLADIILKALTDPDLRSRVAEHAVTVRSELSWQRVVTPIAAFLEQAAFSPDALAAARQAAEARKLDQYQRQLEQRLEHLGQKYAQLEQSLASHQQITHQVAAERDALYHHLEDIRRGRIMRILNRVNRWLGRD
jgi:GT2 family glycosyltransferase/glycosyltransferase involved in cell wall biosynthesis